MKNTRLTLNEEAAALAPYGMLTDPAVKARELAVQVVLAETAFELNDHVTTAIAAKKARDRLMLLTALTTVRGTQSWFDSVVAPWARRLHEVENDLDLVAA
jgi:hypothetical protein